MTGKGRHLILLIEADPEIQHLLSTSLTEMGHEVALAETASEAADQLSRGGVDLVLLELVLPDADGRTVLTRIREDPQTASTPVLVVSSRNGEGVRRECYALGADAFFRRPFDPDALLTDVRVQLRRAEQRERTTLEDPLTGLLNLPGLRMAYDGCVGPRQLVMIELDGFTDVLDQRGWATAERVVCEVGGALDTSTPESVRCARSGGGEFALVCSGADRESLGRVAQSALTVIRALSIEDPEREPLRVTASMGVTTAGDASAFDEAVAVARSRLFAARAQGGNRIVFDDPPEGASTTRIIVADDDDIAATLLIHRLEKAGLEVARFDNGQDALEAVIEQPPDLVILDMKMPLMDGFEVVERLRRTPTCAAIPVILLTSMGSEADIVRGFELGADDYILKPFSPIELLARVQRLLARTSHQSTA